MEENQTSSFKEIHPNNIFSCDAIYIVFNRITKKETFCNGRQVIALINDNEDIIQKLRNKEIDSFLTDNYYVKFHKQNTIKDNLKQEIASNYNKPSPVEIDVSGCYFFDISDRSCQAENLEKMGMHEYFYCEDNYNCYYKQLAKKEQELQQEKQRADEAEKKLDKYKIIDKPMESFKKYCQMEAQLQQSNEKLESIRHIAAEIENDITFNPDRICNLAQQIIQLTKERK
ncbi:MAG: hypothetical protein PHV37_01855 [Candidatus Gastranaerophilales bacterium]|nr:hypothetical protein [Candidatus Gastranaerophilales bacterium]